MEQRLVVNPSVYCLEYIRGDIACDHIASNLTKNSKLQPFPCSLFIQDIRVCNHHIACFVFTACKIRSALMEFLTPSCLFISSLLALDGL